jgi:hypothetical protein
MKKNVSRWFLIPSDSLEKEPEFEIITSFMGDPARDELWSLSRISASIWTNLVQTGPSHHLACRQKRHRACLFTLPSPPPTPSSIRTCPTRIDQRQ